MIPDYIRYQNLSQPEKDKLIIEFKNERLKLFKQVRDELEAGRKVFQKDWWPKFREIAIELWHLRY